MQSPGMHPKAEPVSMSLFFKYKGRVKKSTFTGSTLEDLTKAFLERFPEFPPFSSRPFTVMHPEAKVGHEVDDMSDLYPNCVLEMSQDGESQTQQSISKRSVSGLAERERMVLCMVGLPARGKTFIASKICHLLNWMGIPAKVFNVGEYRRARVGPNKPHQFFDPNNAEGQRVLLHCSLAALDDMMMWLGQGGGHVAIFDAANIRTDRRKLVATRCQREGINKIIYVESVCDDPLVIEANIRETKLWSPDYETVTDPAEAVADLNLRISHYLQDYETITDNEKNAYIKIFDGGRRMELRAIQGYLPGRLVFFLMNLHITPRTIWLARAGECEYQTQNRIGGDSDLTGHGEEFAHRLAQWVDENIPRRDDGSESELVVWTSTLRRAVRTGQYLPHPKVQLRGLDDLERGICDGLTADEVAAEFPDEFAARCSDKLGYRYPRGESYEDITQRLEPVILELERSRRPVLIISHQAPLRCLYAYLMGVDQTQCPHIPIPMHTIIALTPKAYGCEIRTYNLLEPQKPPSVNVV